MNKRQKRGMILLAVGLVLVLGGLGIHLMQLQEDAAAGKTATILLQQLDYKLLPTDEESPDPSLPGKKYMDYTLIGSIRIPSVEIQLPVLDQWNEDMLKVAPCRYAGSLSGNDMVIMGHNYKTHFNNLNKIKIGTEVEFENTTGKVFRYRVAKIEHLHSTEGEKLPTKEYPLTIFTCKPGGLDRIVVRCESLE